LRDDKEILKRILIDSEVSFLKWAIDVIVNWENSVRLHNVFHIHGDNDRILPVEFVNYNEKIRNGGHLMTLTESDALNGVLQKLLSIEEVNKTVI